MKAIGIAEKIAGLLDADHKTCQEDQEVYPQDTLRMQVKRGTSDDDFYTDVSFDVQNSEGALYTVTITRKVKP